MTRKEEIENAAKQKYPYEGGTKGTICEWSIPIFIQGAEWADKTMIEKVCEWLKLNAEDYVVTCYDKGELDSEGLLMDFRKAMEE